MRTTIVGALLSVAGASAAATSLPLSDAPAFRRWYGLGSTDTAAACTPAVYRGFDFWIGEWAVRGAAGGDAGRSSIRRTLRGCAISEVFGNSGRSLSAWRPQSREWLQTYVDNTGLTLRFRGRASQDSMILADSVRHVGGSSGIKLASRMTWSRADARRVRQVWWLSRDGGTTWPLNFDGTYSPDSARFSADSPSVGPHECERRPGYRALDALLGEWSVAETDSTPYASSRITGALHGCLLEERLTSRNGYERVSIIALDRYTGSWIWASVDNRGTVERFVAQATAATAVSFENELSGGRRFCLRVQAESTIGIEPTCDGEGGQRAGVTYRRVQSAPPAASSSEFFERASGRWAGAGTLAGRPMLATYSWTNVPGRREMAVALTPPGGATAVFDGRLVFQDSDGAGRWTDSQGGNFAVDRVALSRDSLVTAWGPPSARGQSVYRLHAADSLEVRDYRRDAATGAATLFGRYSVRRIAAAVDR